MDVARATRNAFSALAAVTDIIADAVEEHPDAAAKLQACGTECKKGKQVIDLIRKHKSLQTAGVLAITERIQSVAGDIDEHIASLDGHQGKSRPRDRCASS